MSDGNRKLNTNRIGARSHLTTGFVEITAFHANINTVRARTKLKSVKITASEKPQGKK